MEKINNEQIISLFRNNGYNIIGDIKNSTTKILCERHGYWYKTSYHNLKSGKKPSLWGFCNIDNLEHNICVNLRERNIKSMFICYEIVKHKNKKRILLKFECECGKEFNKILEDTIYNTYVCCQECVKIKRGLTSRRSVEHVNAISNAGYKIISNTKDIKNTDYVEVEDKDGYRGFVSAASVASGKHMSKFDIRINKKYYVENVNHYAELNGLDIQCLSIINKRHTRQSLLFRCGCGNEFVTSLSYFQTGKARCEICSKSISSYELSFKKYLDNNNIKYIQQYALNQCRDTLPLPFDFFLPEYKCMVEIDGEGHFRSCNFNHISHSKALLSYYMTIKHDNIKTNYCNANNVKLLRLTYKNFKDDSYKSIFQNFIKGVAPFS